MNPSTLLKASTEHRVLVELRDGETFTGVMVNNDPYMNLNLKDVVRTTSDGARFFHLDTCYLRGVQIRGIRLDPKLLDSAPKEENSSKPYNRQPKPFKSNRGRGGGANRGRGGKRGS